jgi:hypothetical protein
MSEALKCNGIMASQQQANETRRLLDKNYLQDVLRVSEENHNYRNHVLCPM